MSGWIKFEKDLEDDPRVRTMARHMRDADVTHGRFTSATLAFPVSDYIAKILGGLAKLWFYADKHIRDDNTIPLGIDEINEIIGIEGFCQFLPENWFVILDPESIELPDFLEHNGPEAKKAALNAKRQARHRDKVTLKDAQDKRNSNGACVTGELPDKTRLDKTRRKSAAGGDQTPESEIRARVIVIRTGFPEAAHEDWITAEKLIRNIVANGLSSWEELEAGVERYGKYCRATNRIVTNPAKWFADISSPWLSPWTIPEDSAKRQVREKLEADWNTAKMRAAAVGFRSPLAHETPASYLTQIQRAEEQPRNPVRGVAELAGQMRMAK